MTVSPVAGFKGKVALISSLLYATTMAFTPAAVEGGGGTAVLSVAPAREAIKGTYIVSITGIDGGFSHMVTVTVNVK